MGEIRKSEGEIFHAGIGRSIISSDVLVQNNKKTFRLVLSFFIREYVHLIFCSSAKVVSPRLFSSRLSAFSYTLLLVELTTVVAI